MRLSVIDLDGAVSGHPPLSALIEAERAQTIPARDLAPRLRIVASRPALDELTRRLHSAPPPPGRGADIVFYGSGDFHHLTTGLVARHPGPLTIVQVDNHPDWTRFPATMNCGAWVNRALELPQVEKVVTLGPCSDDLVWPEFKTANLAAIEAGRLAVFPWRHGPSTVMQRLGSSPCWRQDGLKLHWTEIGHGDFARHVEAIIAAIPTRDVYVTIDKDALIAAEAVTNWDQGGMRLADIETLMRALAAARTIIGVDVCGDWSEPLFDDWFRRTLSFTDRARTIPPPDAHAINARTNSRLLDLFREVGL
jgi:arginase family enzyme